MRSRNYPETQNSTVYGSKIPTSQSPYFVSLRQTSHPRSEDHKKGPESKSTSTIPLRWQLVGFVSLFVFATSSIPSPTLSGKDRKGQERTGKEQKRNSLDRPYRIQMRYTNIPSWRFGVDISPCAGRCSTRGEEIREADRRSRTSLAVVMW